MSAADFMGFVTEGKREPFRASLMPHAEFEPRHPCRYILICLLTSDSSCKGDFMGAENWYYAQGGQAAGPVRLEALQQMAAAGDVRATDMFWREGLVNWIPG